MTEASPLDFVSAGHDHAGEIFAVISKLFEAGVTAEFADGLIVLASGQVLAAETRLRTLGATDFEVAMYSIAARGELKRLATGRHAELTLREV